MMSEHRPDGKLTLEDLLRLKQAERPPVDFWTNFERELRTRQLAAAVEKPRWWFGFPRVFAGFARYQMPMGAAAVLAVTFLTLREYREPGFEPAFSAPAPARSVVTAEPEAPVVEMESDDSGYLQDFQIAPSEAAPVRNEPARRPTSPAVASTGGATTEAPATPPMSMSPSARSIAVNLAAIEPELGRILGGPAVIPAETRSIREPLAELTALRDARRQPLFAYNADLANEAAGRDGSRATDRIGNRINETELYDSVRRLSGGGDRLTLKF